MLKIVNIVIPARNFSATTSFYQNILNLPVKFEGEGFCFLDDGGVNIAIYPEQEDSEFSPTGRGIYLDMSIDEHESMKNHLEKHEVEIQCAWEDHIGKFLLIADPEGNLIELIEYHQS